MKKTKSTKKKAVSTAVKPTKEQLKKLDSVFKKHTKVVVIPKKGATIPGKAAVNKVSNKLPKYFYWQSPKNKLWYFNLEGANGEIQHPSESYTTKSSAIRGIKRVQKNAPLASIHFRK